VASLRRDMCLLAILLAVAAGLRAWQISHTEVAARDSIGFIRYAWELEHKSWSEVLRHHHQHPGYPVLLLIVSWPIRHFLPAPNWEVMQLSAQLASALAGVALVIPMFYLGRSILGRNAAFWGTAIFQCLPVVSRVMADGLSEGTFLLFAVVTLLLAVRALSTNSKTLFALCGMCGGLAYLTRPEGGLILAATGIVLFAMQASQFWRRSWGQFVACGASLVLAATAVSSPYIYVIGSLTTKPTPRAILGTVQLKPQKSEVKSQRSEGGFSPLNDLKPPTLDLRRPMIASLFAVYAPDDLKKRGWWALKAVGIEVFKAAQYAIAVAALLGIYWCRRRLRVLPGAWMLLVLCLLHALVLWRLAMLMGYVSERHVLVLVLCSVFPAAAAIPIYSRWGTAQTHWLWFGREATTQEILIGSSRFSVLLLICATLTGLPESLKTLHANRAGHRDAGLWLAEHADQSDPIIDPFCWAHYYAGRVFSEDNPPPVPPGHVPTRYVVLESPDREHARLPLMPEARALAARGQLVYHWPLDKSVTEGKVFVFAVAP
jgi:hypothetical protein